MKDGRKNNKIHKCFEGKLYSVKKFTLKIVQPFSKKKRNLNNYPNQVVEH